MERQYSIDIAKGITIICVVIFHASASTDPTFYYFNYLIIPTKLLDSFIMPLFFMVSAALLRLRLERDNFSAIEFLKKITASILIPFYTLSFLFFMINILAPKSLNPPTAREMIKAVLYMQTKWDSMPSGVLWFLFVLFAFNLFTFIFVRVLNINIYLLLTMSALLKLTSLYYLKETYYFAISYMAPYYIYFVAGYILSRHIYTARNIGKTKFVVIFLICWLISFYLSLNMKPDIIHILLVISGSGGICSTLFILGLSYKIYNPLSHSKPLRFLRFCGTNSILIYVFHTPTFLIMRRVEQYFNIYGSLWGFIATIFAGIFFPLIYGKILSYHAATYKLLLGRST